MNDGTNDWKSSSSWWMISIGDNDKISALVVVVTQRSSSIKDCGIEVVAFAVADATAAVIVKLS